MNTRIPDYTKLRQTLKLDYEPDSHLVVKIAESRRELEEAFQLLHDSYVEYGYMKMTPDRIRVTPYHALPSTSVLVTKWQDRVVGTLSLIRETAFGLPMNKLFDLQALRSPGGAITEVSSLAVHPEFRGRDHEFLMPMLKFCYHYCRKNTRYWVIAVNPRHQHLYRWLLGFESLPRSNKDNYDFVNGAPAIGQYCDIASLRERLIQDYSDLPLPHNLYSYFEKARLPNLMLPKRDYYTVTDPVLSPELLEHFFLKRTSVLSQINEGKLRHLHRVYKAPAFRQVLPPLPSPGPDTQGAVRIEVRCPGQIDTTTHREALTVHNVSRFGFGGRSPLALSVGTKVPVKIRLGDFETVRIHARVRWADNKGSHGFEVVAPSRKWKRIVGDLEKASHQGEKA